VSGKCPYCPAHYSTNEELVRHIEAVWNHYPERSVAAEKEMAGLREHAELLDRNWSTLHNASVDAIRKVLGMPDATVPEIVEAIERLKGSRHCFSRSCLRGSPAGDRATAIKDLALFRQAGCECSCANCYDASMRETT